MSEAPSPLDFKVPPVAVFVVCVALMLALAALFPGLAQPFATIHWAAIGMCFASAAILGLSAIRQFRSAGTTIHPQRAEATSTLVRDGIYSFTRNPMYLGLAMLLGAVAAYTANPVSVIGIVLFILYIGRFQIAPEERILRAKYGAEFDRYCRIVRRWI